MSGLYILTYRNVIELTDLKQLVYFFLALNVCAVPFLSAWLCVTIVARLQATILEGLRQTQRKPSAQSV